MWSLGCIFFELAHGHRLFETGNDLQHLAMMERALGTIPAQMASETRLPYFNQATRRLLWNAESSAGLYVRDHCQPLLSSIPEHVLAGTHIELSQWIHFMDLLRKMLTFEPDKRLTLVDAMQHTFFTSPL